MSRGGHEGPPGADAPEPGASPAGDRERRLDALREEARRKGRVSGTGHEVDGGPIPAAGASGRGGRAGAPAPPAGDGGRPGYYGQPILKPPVWTWEVPTYFFVGGLAGMSGVVAAAARFVAGDDPLALAALWIAALGAAASALLLISDLGRPSRFLHMLRVFKRRSPMSVGAWTLTLFGGASAAALVLAAAEGRAAAGASALHVLASVAVVATAVLGAVLGTYTGVLVGATAVPAWREHRLLLPAHFGIAGLGSSAALLLLLGFQRPALLAIGLAAAGAECLVGAAVELARRGAADRAVRRGRAGALLRGGGLLTGPAALVLWILGLTALGAWAFLAGALLTRFGWLAAGRASALDPEAALSRR